MNNEFTKIYAYLSILICLSSGLKAQQTLAFQGFESNAPANEWSLSTGGIPSSVNSGYPANGRIRSDSSSHQTNNSSDTLIFTPFADSTHSRRYVEIWNASVAANNSNGCDGSDYIKVWVDSTGSFSGTPHLRINGNNNVKYGMSGTGTVAVSLPSDTIYSYPSGGNKSGNDAKSRLAIHIPDSWKQVHLKIVLRNNAANEFWCIDDVALKVDTSAIDPPLATDFHIQQVTSDKMALQWKAPALSDGFWVLAREGDTVDIDIEDAWGHYDFDSLSSNGDFSSAIDLVNDEGFTGSAGNKLVYAGTDSNATITGLQEGQSYYFKIYNEYGTAAWSQGLESSPQQSTSAVPEINHFTAIADTASIRLQWNKAPEAVNEYWDKVIIIAREQYPVSSDINKTMLDSLLNGVLPASSNWNARSTTNDLYDLSSNQLGVNDSNYVVYNDTGSTITLTQLDKNIRYYFKAFVYYQDAAMNDVWSPAASSHAMLNDPPIRIAYCGFETSGDTWNKSVTPVSYHDSASYDTWAQVTQMDLSGAANDIDSAAEGAHFWGGSDLNNPIASGYHDIDFDPMDISDYKNVQLFIQYQTRGLDASDQIRYQVAYDQDTGWSPTDYTDLNKDTDAWITDTTAVPDSANYLRLRLRVKQDGNSDCIGWDHIRLTGTLKEPITWNGIVWSNSTGPDSSSRLQNVIIESGHAWIYEDAIVNKLIIRPGASLTISSGKTLTVRSRSRIEADTLAYGQVIGAIEGQVCVEQCISSSGWHHLACPIDSANLLQLEDDITVHYSGHSNGESIARWDASNSQWTFPTNSNASFSETAYTVYINDDFVPDGGGIHGDGKLPVIIDVEGSLRNGTVTAPTLHWHNGNGSPFIGNAPDGWNFITNPYSSNLDWQRIRTDIGGGTNASYYVWDSEAGQYRSHNGLVGHPLLAGKIAPMQGFFVKLSSNADVNTTAFDFTNNDRSTDDPAHFMKAPPQQLSLYITDASGATDETYLYFEANASTGFDQLYDAYKLKSSISGAPSFYSLIADGIKNIETSINAQPLLTDSAVVALGFESSLQQTCTLWADLDNIDPLWQVQIEDLHSGQIHDLRNGAYTFSHQPSGAAERFILRTSLPHVAIDEGDQKTPLIQLHRTGNQLTVHFRQPLPGEVSIEVFNLLGQKILGTKDNHPQGTFHLQLPNGKSHPYLLVRVTHAGSDHIWKL